MIAVPFVVIALFSFVSLFCTALALAVVMIGAEPIDDDQLHR